MTVLATRPEPIVYDTPILAGRQEEIRRRGVVVVKGADRPIAVFHHEGGFYAVDNRCPHMGFPLHRGSVQDGILTCHWHHARFDLCSGCAFDLFADDVPAFDVELRGDEVWVGSLPRRKDLREHHRRRLGQAMEQNLPLIQAKAIIGLLRQGVDYREIVRDAVLFGVRYRDGWASGLTILTAMANLVPDLAEETAYLALYQGVRRTAADCAGMTPRRDRHPLETDEVDANQLDRWLRTWTITRHRDGAERTLLTAIRAGWEQDALTRLVFTAATERFYADTGHVLDFCNKSFEALDLIGWEHSPQVLPSVMAQLVAARGGEELNSWRHPADLVPLVREAEGNLGQWFEQGRGKAWSDVQALAGQLLQDDPAGSLGAIETAIRAGARPEQLSSALSYAAALRIARFGNANEFGDWITALHTFSFCNALHQAIKRCPDPVLVRR